MLPRIKTVRRSACLNSPVYFTMRERPRDTLREQPAAAQPYVVRTTSSSFAACFLKMPAADVSAVCKCLVYSYRRVDNAFKYKR